MIFSITFTQDKGYDNGSISVSLKIQFKATFHNEARHTFTCIGLEMKTIDTFHHWRGFSGREVSVQRFKNHFTSAKREIVCICDMKMECTNYNFVP